MDTRLFAALLLVCTSPLFGQVLPPIAFSSSGLISTIQMTGTATRIYGSDRQTGTVTLQASANGQSQMQLSLSAGTWTETQSAATPFEGQCTTTDFNNVAHSAASFNCWRGMVWFLPQISLQNGSGWSDNTGTYTATTNGGTFHYQRRPQGIMSNSTAALIARFSAYDLHVDLSGQIVSLTFNTHPDDDPSVDIPVEINFSNYQAVAGVLVPLHIQKFINHGLVLDLQIANVQINPTLPSGTATGS